MRDTFLAKYNITFNFNMQCFWSEPLSNDFTVA